jgi:hypothetical protein
MGIVDAERLNRHLSSPNWTDEQWSEAAQLCDEVESELADLLNTHITPVPLTETVAVLDSGLVATSYPVAAVTELGATPIVGGVLPDGWVLREHRLYQETQQPGAPLLSLLDPAVGWAARVAGRAAVRVSYQAGWGDEPTLRKAILKKTGAIMQNRHDDTVTVRDLTASQPPPLVEEWTTAELTPLGIYRNLVIVR